jgi:hypothetical protein
VEILAFKGIKGTQGLPVIQAHKAIQVFRVTRETKETLVFKMTRGIRVIQASSVPPALFQ